MTAGAVHATVGLEPDRKYRVCLVATNEFGNATVRNEVAKRAQETAAATAAKQKQYDEIATEIAGLKRREAEADKHAKAEKAKPKPASCRKRVVKRKTNGSLRRARRRAG